MPNLQHLRLSDQQIDELCISTGTYPKDASEETKAEWRKRYRKVELETEEMISKYDSIEAWYESGEGRLLNL